MEKEIFRFDEESWVTLPKLLTNLPEPVRLHIWGDEKASEAEGEAARLARILSDRFERIDYRLFPRRVNYAYYPVIGILRLDGDEAVDHGLRFIGLPAGYQMTSFIAAIQNVAFRGSTSEARTRIHLHRLQYDITLELITTAEDEAGVIMAHRVCNLAVVSPHIRTFIIMGDAFPEAIIRYSINHVPHLVINEKTHVEGILDEESILNHIAKIIPTPNERSS